MKKEDKSLDKELFPCNIYIDDIQEITEILEKANKKIKYKIDDYEETENIENLNEKTTKTLDIIAYDDDRYYDLRIKFTTNSTDIRTLEKDLTTAGLINKIEEYLESRRSKWKSNILKIPYNKIFYIVIAINFFSVYFEITKNSSYVYIAIIPLYIIMAVLDIQIQFRIFNKIKLIVRKNENKGKLFSLIEHPILAAIIAGLILIGFTNIQFNDKAETKIKLDPKLFKSLKEENKILLSNDKEETKEDIINGEINIYLEKVKIEKVKKYTKYILKIKSKNNNTKNENLYLMDVYSTIKKYDLMKDNIAFSQSVKKALEMDERIILKIERDERKEPIADKSE